MVNQIWVHWARRGLRAAVASALVLLAACGSSSKYDEFIPKRIVSIGDALSYIGTSGTGRYTVNFPAASTDVNNWVRQVAKNYGLSNSQVVEAISATAKAVSTDLQPLLDTISPQTDDLLLISVGIQDVITQGELVVGGHKSASEAARDVKEAGNRYRDFAISQLDRGFPRIFMMPVFDFSNSPYTSAYASAHAYPSYGSLISQLVASFNEGAITEAGQYPSSKRKILTYTDGLLVSFAKTPAYYVPQNIFNVTDAVCTEADVRSCSTETPTSLLTTSYNTYFYTKDFYPTPVVQRYFGNIVYSFFRGGRGW